MDDFIFATEEVIKQYRSHRGDLFVTAVNRASIKVRDGEIALIYGKAGCGKSAYLRLCAGLDYAYSGSIKIRGVDILKLEPDELALYRGIHTGIIFSTPALIPKYTVKENITLPALMAGRQKYNYANHYEKIMKLLNLSSLEKVPAHKLTTGTSQRVSAARALINRPQVLFADEPESILDDEEKGEFLHLFYQTARALSQTVIYAAKAPHDTIKYDRIFKMEDGFIAPILSGQPAPQS